MRLVIAGVPKAGKTTRAKLGGVLGGAAVRHTDDLIAPDRAWSDVSAIVAEWFSAPGPWIVEGVAVVRSLRKWLAAHPEGKPADRVVWLDTPRVELSRGQRALAAGCRTVWAQVRPVLLARNVHIEEP